ncbi:translation initiation factor IF-2-like [Mustela putorius furo]|uniref:Translation initiation factor IF-2-like n=1 Tax=Mustela putorius furo TaxID=9669 RepID=A0A8U0RI53_MUSPF|nr:translation initiation factor IF-2-like [Mustela putorius furo]
MSRRRGAAPRPLGLYLRGWESLPDPLGTERRVLAATGSEPAGRAARNPERAAGHPGTCSPGRRMGPRTPIHTCAPQPGSALSPAPGSRRAKGSCFFEGRAAARRRLGARRQPPGVESRPPRRAALARLCPPSPALGARYRTRTAGRRAPLRNPIPPPVPTSRGPSRPPGRPPGGDKPRERGGSGGALRTLSPPTVLSSQPSILFPNQVSTPFRAAKPPKEQIPSQRGQGCDEIWDHNMVRGFLILV